MTHFSPHHQGSGRRAPYVRTYVCVDPSPFPPFFLFALAREWSERAHLIGKWGKQLRFPFKAVRSAARAFYLFMMIYDVALWSFSRHASRHDNDG
jgi:hypothetical protein